MGSHLLQNVKYVKALDPVADYTSGDVSTDVINMQDYKTITFFVYKGLGTTGTATATIDSCDNVTPTTPTAVAFRYSSNTATDVIGDLTEVASTGVLISAGSSQIWAFSVDDHELSGSNKYVRLTLTEVNSTAVLGGVMAMLSGAGDAGDDLRSVIV